MRKWIYSFAIVSLFSSLVLAINAPQDARGVSLNTIDWIGAETCSITAATTSNTVICSSGAVIAYGVIASSIAVVQGQYVVFRDTNVGTNIAALSTVTIVSSVGTGSPSSATVPGAVNFFRFPVPIKLNTGLAVTPGATVTTGGQWTILYRRRNPTVSE